MFFAAKIFRAFSIRRSLLVISVAALPSVGTCANIAADEKPASAESGTTAVQSSSAGPAIQPEVDTSNMSYSVRFIGRTLGYFRNLDFQAITLNKDEPLQTENACADDEERYQALKDIKQDFSKAWEPESDYKNLIRVAVGDNFAPNLGSRTYIAQINSNKRVLVSKDLFTFVADKSAGRWVRDEDAGDHTVASGTAVKDPERPNESVSVRTLQMQAGAHILRSDNVGCFMRRMHFDAIVPGKHDFYFGPEHLRSLARFLARPEDKYGSRPVQMLGANLVIETSIRDAAPALPPEDVEHRGYSQKPDPQSIYIRDGNTIQVCSDVKPELSKSVMPWLSQVTVNNAIQLSWTPGNSKTPVTIGCGKGSAQLPKELQNIAIGPEKRELKVSGGLGGTVKILPPVISEVYICKADRQRPEKFGADQCQQRMDLEEIPSEKLTPNLTFRIPQPAFDERAIPRDRYGLTPDENYMLCIKGIEDSSSSNRQRLERQPYCTPFTVQSPFFEYQNARMLYDTEYQYAKKRGTTKLAQEIHQDPTPRPYWINEAHTIAVFGVVDPSLMDYVGVLNYSWLAPHDNTRITKTVVLDPAETLTGLLQYCDLQKECKNTRKVLLAHMPQESASRLAAEFGDRIDLVLAQPDETQAADDGESMTRVIPKKDRTAGKNVTSKPRAFLLAPGYQMKVGEERTLNVRIATAEVRIATATDKTQTREVTNHVYIGCDRRVDVIEGRPALQAVTATEGTAAHETLWKSFCGNFATQQHLNCKPDQVEPKLIQNVTLASMRKACAADAALLQARDFYALDEYLDTKLSPAERIAAIQTMLWKGDVVLCETVTGAMLKAMLAQSDQFRAQEGSGLSDPLQHDRGLITSGIIKDPGTGESIVSGQVIDDKRLYSIAISNYLSAGDTGYPILKTTVLNHSAFPNRKAPLRFVWLEVAKKTENLDDNELTGDTDKITMGDYFDELRHAPFNASHGLTATRASRDWLVHSLRITRSFASTPPGDRLAEQHPFWSLRLDSFDFGYKSLLHSGSEKHVQAEFNSNPLNTLTAYEFSDVTTDWNTRAQHYWSRWSFFAQDDAAADKFQQRANPSQNPAESYVVSLRKNYWGNEVGMLYSILPGGRNPDSLNLLLSGRVETPIFQPFATYQLADPAKTQIINNIARYIDTFGKAGLRYQSRKSWVEAGFLGGANFNSIDGYIFSGPATPKPIPCPLTGDASVANCIKLNPELSKGTQIVTTTRTLFERGWFVNFRMEAPLPIPRTSFISENRGEWFYSRPGEDLVYDTKYLDDWKNSLQITWFGNLTLSPSVDTFFYENKVTEHHYHSYQTAVTLGYHFDWHQGMRWDAALRYDSPKSDSSSAKPLPNDFPLTPTGSK